MKSALRYLLSAALLIGPPSVASTSARADQGQRLDRLTQEVRTLTDEVRRLQDEIRSLATHRPVGLLDVPKDLSRAKADAVCHQLGGSVQALVQDTPTSAKLACRF